MKTKNHKLFSILGLTYSWISMLTIIAVCLFLFITVFYYGHSVISIGFLTQEPNASAMDFEGSGILTPLIGTLILTIVGITVSLPFALATSIYFRYYAKAGLLNNLISRAIDILSGVPTIVIALFSRAIFTLPQFAWLSTMVEVGGNASSKAYGKSFLVAGVTMAVMILPFIIKAITESLKSVPQSYIDGSIALGVTKWRTISKVALLTATPGIVTGVLLGMGRIIGDTAIVWLALGGTLRMTGMQPWYNVNNWLSTLQNTGSTLTSYIYYTSPAGEGNSYTTAFGASLVLMLLIILFNFLSVLIGRVLSRGGVKA